MIRRHFLKSGALAITGGSLQKAGSASPPPREFVIENRQLAWRLLAKNEGIRSTAFENRLSGSSYKLSIENEFTLVLATGKRIEIPWWNFQLADSGDAPAGIHTLAGPAGKWNPVRNLGGGQKGRVYTGYGWFRHEFALPEAARGHNLTFVLGGYDEQDWNQHSVYVNSEVIGHRAVSSRWRVPGRHVMRPSDAAYASLTFGESSRNVLAVRARGYDYQVEGVSGEALEQYVFRPFLFDQFISIGEPDARLSRFELLEAHQQSAERCSFLLEDKARQLVVTLYLELDGFLRRKRLEVKNNSSQSLFLLDVELDAFTTPGQSKEGGHGKPVFLDDQVFCAVEHPAGINQGTKGEIRLWHCPGQLIAAGETLRTLSSVVGVGPRDGVLHQFHNYLYANSPRRQKGKVSIFTCFGLNNQWGACPTLNDSQVLDNQKVMAHWQEKGVKLDFFTLDTGWPANDGDLTEFINTCYPDGPAAMIDGIHKLDMQFGLWFSEGWGGWANGSYPPIQAGAIPEPGVTAEPAASLPEAVYRNGYPATGGVGRQMCMAADAYYNVFRKAVLHHVGKNTARLIKFDSGNYYCNSTRHGHLPGKYSTEAITNRMIQIVQAARAIAPEVFVMWYWGEGSPFWALHGDVISESGLFMEGSGTSQFPTLYYRDSVTLSLDQNTQFAKLIPPLNKDSLGVWLSPIRWGNFMGRERWREALVMDLGRGSLVFPQLWGDPNLLNDSDLAFLAEMIELAHTHEKVLQGPRRTFGDTWKNEPYGYCFGDSDNALIFCHNAHFTAREFTLPLGPSPSRRIMSHFPERSEIVSRNDTPLPSGSLTIWMRPFETLLLEVRSAVPDLPKRWTNEALEGHYGSAITLEPGAASPRTDLKFADAPRFESAGMRLKTQYFTAKLPALSRGRHLFAIAVSLKKNGRYFRYSPVVAELVQLRGRLADHEIQMIPVPDARRYGNTQHSGCSWVLYKIPLSSQHSNEPLEFGVHAYLPEGVEANTEAWIVKQWWQEGARPEADGFYGDSPS